MCYNSELRSLAYGPKGSYRTEHVVNFINRHLEDFGDQRRADGDWRLIFLDAFKPHLDDETTLALWRKGYIPVYHGGGTTGVAQVNDTDCHAAFEREYLNVEAQTLLDQQLIDPGDISRSRQQVCQAMFDWGAVGLCLQGCFHSRLPVRNQQCLITPSKHHSTLNSCPHCGQSGAPPDFITAWRSDLGSPTSSGPPSPIKRFIRSITSCSDCNQT